MLASCAAAKAANFSVLLLLAVDQQQREQKLLSIAQARRAHLGVETRRGGALTA